MRNWHEQITHEKSKKDFQELGINRRLHSILRMRSVQKSAECNVTQVSRRQFKIIIKKKQQETEMVYM